MFIISGLTPLGRATERGYTEICDLLLTHGADVTKENNTGMSINVELHFLNKIYNDITTYLFYTELNFQIFTTSLKF